MVVKHWLLFCDISELRQMQEKKKTHNWTLLHLWLFLHLSYNTNLDIQTVTVSPELTEAYSLHAGIVSSGNNSIHLGLLERKPRVEKWQHCCSSSPGLIIYSLWGTTAVLSISSFFFIIFFAYSYSRSQLISKEAAGQRHRNSLNGSSGLSVILLWFFFFFQIADNIPLLSFPLLSRPLLMSAILFLHSFVPSTLTDTLWRWRVHHQTRGQRRHFLHHQQGKGENTFWSRLLKTITDHNAGICGTCREGLRLDVRNKASGFALFFFLFFLVGCFCHQPFGLIVEMGTAALPLSSCRAAAVWTSWEENQGLFIPPSCPHSVSFTLSKYNMLSCPIQQC